METDVLVVGAGPTGLALACGLVQQGISVRVIDKADGPATTSRANILHARGTEVLSRLGALGDLPRRCVSAVQVRMHAQDKEILNLQFGRVDGAKVNALVCSQAEVERALRVRLAELGGKIHWGEQLHTAEQHRDGVTATTDAGQLQARWLVGCDGAHSVVRKLAGVGFPGAPVAEQFLLADVRMDTDLDRSGTAGWYHQDGVLIMMPMRGGDEDRWRLMADVPLGGDLDKESIVDKFRELLVRRAGIAKATIRGADWTSPFRIHRRLATEYRSGRLVLAGDAAHIHSPFGGQGMNTGIGDAENLAWKLALVLDGRADESVVDTYQAERRPLAEDVLSGTTLVTKLQLGADPVSRFLRDFVMLPLVKLPSVQRYATVTASQLTVSYRRGPLGAGLFGRKPSGGDRVPDFSITSTDGAPSTVHRELRGGNWVLLTDDPVAGELVRQRLGSRVNVLRGHNGQTWLVRPDGHLAWRGGFDSGGLRRWLVKALSR